MAGVGAAIAVAEATAGATFAAIALADAMLGPRADVTAAATLAEARGLVAREKFDLSILDVGLPDGSGLDLLPELKASRHATTPVLVFSASPVTPQTHGQVSAALLKSGASHEDLVGTIRRLLGRETSPGRRASPALDPA